MVWVPAIPRAADADEADAMIATAALRRITSRRIAGRCRAPPRRKLDLWRSGVTGI